MAGEQIIANDILNYMDAHHLDTWSTVSKKCKKVKSSLPGVEFYENPYIISRGVSYLLREGTFVRISNRRYIRV